MYRFLMTVFICCLYFPLQVFAGNIGNITSPFGWRVHPITGNYSFHAGVDIAYEHGTQIGALFPGKVVFSNWWEGYGNVVILAHDNGTNTVYAHCSALYVKTGQSVNAGDLIVAVGSTGNSTGPHLHLELWQNNQYIDPYTLWRY